VLLLAGVVAVPAKAQSSSGVQYPVVLGLAQSDLLVTAAPRVFAGCMSGDTLVWQTSMPKLDLYSFFWVNDEGAPLWDLRLVLTPLGAVNVTWNGDAWIRVFRLSNGDLDSYKENPCLFYSMHPYVAEGAGRLSLHSADDAVVGPGANSWGYALQGTLDDNGYCGGGSVRLSWLQKWISFSQTDYTIAKSTSSKLTLSCK
jgi:hypothetical protein